MMILKLITMAVPSGVYLARVRTCAGTISAKIVLAK
jgi:hypothetical protein